MNFPLYLTWLFIAITVATLILLYATLKSVLPSRSIKILFGGIILWAVAQAVLANAGFYASNLDAMPPRFIFGFLPALVFIAYLFSRSRSKAYIEQLPLKSLTWISIVRIPVEIGLYGLFVASAIPELMTFSGRNFDILAGITAPLVVFTAFQNGELVRKRLLIIWNTISLLLLVFIILNALLSAPFPIQQFGFDQPNYGVLHFPFIWLPTIIVPVVLFSHFASIRLLMK